MPPNGEATESEAAAPAVRVALAHALWMLGRHSEIDDIPLDQISASDIALIHARQASDRGDPSALPRMKRAVAQADDASSLRAVLLALAFLGEVDDAAMSDVSGADAALFRGVAALHRDDPGEAVRILVAHRFKSPIHADFFAQAQRKMGKASEAVRTLLEATEHLGVESLRVQAVEILIEQERLEDAESMAVDALAGSLPHLYRRRLRSLTVRISGLNRDWTEMESHARV